MPKSKLAFEDFQLDKANAQLRRGEVLVPLAPKAFDLLCYLIERPGELVTKEDLLSALWPNLNVTESSLTVTITAIRAALGDDAKAPRFIETVTKRGYRFIAPAVSASSSETSRTPEAGSPPLAPAAAQPPRYWVGRSAALETLEGLLSRALAGEKQMVFVTGEAGIGKTTFVEMARERTARDEVGILMGYCIETFGTDEAFLPLTGALRDGCDGPDGPLLLKALRAYAPTWLAQMPTLIEPNDRAALQQEVFGATRERMLREFCDLLEAMSTERPFLWIIEDLHWSDFATLDALSRFARRDRKAKVLILATYRPIDAASHPARTLHQDLQIRGRSTEISLGPLPQNEVEHYLVLRFNHAQIAEGLAGRLYARTKGQPLFFVALVDHLIAQQALVEAEGQWRLAAGYADAEKAMPENLRDMITRQIEALTPDEQRLLETASVAGAEFSAALPAAVLDRDTVEAEQVCETLARSRQIIAPAGMAEWPDSTVAGVYAFNHSLYQQSLYERLPPGKRVRTHGRLGERLETGYGVKTAEIASTLALHFEEGRDYAKAAHYLSEAAENSSRRFSAGEAANYLTRALSLADRILPEEQAILRIKLLQQRGFVQWSSGKLMQAIEDLKLMISYAADSKQLSFEISGLMDLSLCYLYADRRECLNASALAVARSQNVDDYFLNAQALVNSALFKMLLIGWSDEDAAVCRLALKLCADVQETRILIRLCAIGALVNFMVSNYEESHVVAARGKEVAQGIGDIYLYSLCNVLESRSLLHLGRWQHLWQGLQQALAITEKNINPMAVGLCRLMIANSHNEALDFRGAKENCEKVLDLEVDTDPFNFFIGHGILAIAYLGLHEYPAARAQIDQLIHRIEVDEVAMDSVIYPLFYHTLCDYWLAVGDLPRAREQAIRMYEITAPPPELHYLALAHRQLARVAMAKGDFEDAKAQLSGAISIAEKPYFPLAAWRVYLTAFELYNRLGDVDMANGYLHRAEKVIATLAENFDEDDPLHASLLKGFAAEVSQSQLVS